MYGQARTEGTQMMAEIIQAEAIMSAALRVVRRAR